MATADHLSEGAAIYLNQPDGLELWKAQGETGFPDLVSEDTRDPEWFFAPIVIRSKTLAAVCAAGIADREAFGIITDGLRRAIENFGLRIRFFGHGGTFASDALDPTLERASSVEGEGGDLGANAHQLARMLVSEIKVGHEAQVLEGRIHADLYSRLQKRSTRAARPIGDRSTTMTLISTKRSSGYSPTTTPSDWGRTTRVPVVRNSPNGTLSSRARNQRALSHSPPVESGTAGRRTSAPVWR